MIKFQISFATIGLEGRINQDNLMADKFVASCSKLERFSGYIEADDSEKWVFLVSDGAGGGSEGEKASEITVREFARNLENLKCSDTHYALCKALDEANREVCDYYNQDGEIGAATVSGIVLDKEKVWVFNVGDSPVYRLANGILDRVSVEHTVAAERNENCGKETADANTITRYMGNRSESGSGQADISCFDAEPGVVYFIASDGVEKGLKDSAIKRLLSKKKKNIAELITEKAHNNGSGDDTTAIVIKTPAL